MSEVENVIKTAKFKPKSKTSFHLDKEEYEKFKAFCDERGLSLSIVLSALIKDFNDKQKEGSK